jgi:hypothetical protein
LALFICLQAFVASACRPEVHILRPTIIHLSSGDSVLLVATGPILEPQGDTGMMYEYHPFIPLRDTLTLRMQAIDLWRIVREKAESLRVPFVVLRATTRFTELRGVPQPDTVWNYGFVIEKRGDGLWHFLNSTEPVGP